MKSTNIQISNIASLLAESEPELFGRGSAELMPVTRLSSKRGLIVCNARLNDVIRVAIGESERERVNTTKSAYGSHFTSSLPLVLWQPGL
jgi:hypothetical protein